MDELKNVSEGLAAEKEYIQQETCGYKIITAMELLNSPDEETPMVFDNVFPRGVIGAVVGSSEAGKSLFLIQMGMCATSGRDFLKWKNKCKYKSAIIVSTEDGLNEVKKRLKKMNRNLDIPLERLSGLRFIDEAENLLSALDSELSRMPADLVVLDAYSDLYTGKTLNDATETRKFLKDYKDLARKFDCLIMFLHHTGKRTDDLSPSKNNVIGSQSIEASMRLVVELRQDKSDPTLKHLCIVKGNYLSFQEKQSSHVLKFDTENLTFEETGDRVSYDDLGLVTSQLTKLPKSRKFDQFTEKEHITFLQTYVGTGKTSTQIRDLISAHLQASDKTARSFIDRYMENQWLHEVDSKYPKKYAYAEPELPF